MVQTYINQFYKKIITSLKKKFIIGNKLDIIGKQNTI